MANPVFTISREDLAHFQCGRAECRKWWSIGDAEVRDYWFCPWCGVRNAAAADSTDCDEDGVPYWDVPKGILPEWAQYIALDSPRFYADWYCYEFKPRPHNDEQFKVFGGSFFCILDYFKKELILPDITNDQWRNSLRRVRLVEIPSPVQCECINWARESSSTLSDHNPNCKYAAGSYQRNQSS